jgi:hypothetical protein
MAGRILNRRELRKQTDQALQNEAAPADGVAEKPKAKKSANPRVKKPSRKKAPPRMRVRWGVFDGAMKQVAVFDFNQKGAAEGKMAAMLEKSKGPYFLQLVKDEMPAEADSLPGQ